MFHERRPSVELQAASAASPAAAATTTTTTTTSSSAPYPASSAPYPTPAATYPAGGPVYVTSVPGTSYPSAYPTSTLERPGGTTTTYYPASGSLERPGSVYATSTLDRNDRHVLLPPMTEERARKMEQHEARYRRDMQTVPIPQSGLGGFLARHDTMYVNDRSLYKVRSSPLLQLLNVLAYLGALAITILCVAGAFGQTFMGVWDDHTTRFTPAAYVLVLWIVIYFFLALFLLYQLPRYQHTNLVVFRDIHLLFVVACVLNIIYNIFYVLQYFWVAAGVCTGLVCVLVVIYLRIGIGWKRAVAPLEYICVHVPFGFWLGWASVDLVILWATAAFTHLGWNGRPWTGEGWAVLFMCMLLLIAVLMLLFKRDGPFGLSVGFAIVAIAVKQTRRDPIPLAFFIAGGVLMLLSLLALLVKLCLYTRERREKRQVVSHAYAPGPYVATAPGPTYATAYATPAAPAPATTTTYTTASSPAATTYTNAYPVGTTTYTTTSPYNTVRP